MDKNAIYGQPPIWKHQLFSLGSQPDRDELAANRWTHKITECTDHAYTVKFTKMRFGMIQSGENLVNILNYFHLPIVIVPWHDFLNQSSA